VAGRVWAAFADSVDVAGQLDPLSLHQIFEDVVAGFVHVRVDAMRR
jgi:hypothetical protein